MSTLRQSILNPVKFVKKTPDTIPQYVDKHMDEYVFEDTILPWQQKVCGKKHWQKSDTIPFQYESDFGPISLSLFTAEGDLIHTVSLTQVLQNMDFPTFHVYEANLSMQAFDEGYYYFELDCGSPIALTLISGVFKLSELFENSVLLEYWHDVYKDGVFFETGIRFFDRLPGIVKYKAPESRDTIYEDQEANLENLKGIGYDLWTLSLGGSAGIPPEEIRRVNRALTCRNVKINGREYTKNEGSKFEENTVDDYPMSAWSIELRERLRRGGTIYEGDELVIDEFSVVIATDSKGIDNQDGGTNYYVTDVE